ncbi:Hypothetical_protein [Hexamita inflata]|uniref:Hypothetical_protein n=1 Tax=Hexamita inflata TaxID=28002 RepID=A0ABP1J0I2_9EUKA
MSSTDSTKEGILAYLLKSEKTIESIAFYNEEIAIRMLKQVTTVLIIPPAQYRSIALLDFVDIIFMLIISRLLVQVQMHVKLEIYSSICLEPLQNVINNLE